MSQLKSFEFVIRNERILANPNRIRKLFGTNLNPPVDIINSLDNASYKKTQQVLYCNTTFVFSFSKRTLIFITNLYSRMICFY